jgi:hypothetical protein
MLAAAHNFSRARADGYPEVKNAGFGHGRGKVDGRFAGGRAGVRGAGMERWFIVGFVVAIFMVLAVAGWHFHEQDQANTGICASADADCGDRHL